MYYRLLDDIWTVFTSFEDVVIAALIRHIKFEHGTIEQSKDLSATHWQESIALNAILDNLKDNNYDR